MASKTLPVFSYPNFPHVLGASIDQQIRCVDTVIAEAALDRIRQARLLDAERCFREPQPVADIMDAARQEDCEA